MNIFSAKFLSLILVVGSLNGCIATGKLNDKIKGNVEKGWVVDNNLTDNIVALGKPSKPISGYENALVMVGQKNSYLLQGDFDSQSNDLSKIFDTFDLSHLSLHSHELTVKIGTKNTTCQTQNGCMYEHLYFNKPKALVTETEMQKLKENGFHECDTRDNDYVCEKAFQLRVTPIQQAQNVKTLQYKFKQPLKIQFYNWYEDRGKGSRGVMKAMYPLAIVFDVVTAPLQLLFIDLPDM